MDKRPKTKKMKVGRRTYKLLYETSEKEAWQLVTQRADKGPLLFKYMSMHWVVEGHPVMKMCNKPVDALRHYCNRQHKKLTADYKSAVKRLERFHPDA
jgi:hypothetical protein